MLENVPISISFVEKNVSAIIGTAENKQQFIEGLILQMIAYHSYEDLKIDSDDGPNYARFKNSFTNKREKC